MLGLAIPMCLAVAAAAYVARPPPQELQDSGKVFEDKSTGFMFAKEEGEADPERDKDVRSTPLPLPPVNLLFPSAGVRRAPCADWPLSNIVQCFAATGPARLPAHQLHALARAYRL